MRLGACENASHGERVSYWPFNIWISVPESSYFLLGLELGHNGVYLLLQLAKCL